jgi:hypothetical protein
MQQSLEINLGGKNRTFTFGILFLANALERSEFEDYNDMLLKLSKNPFKYAPIMMYESLVNTYKKNKQDIDFTETEIQDWLDEDYADGMNAMLLFINVFMGNTENKTPIEDNKNAKGSKKK